MAINCLTSVLFLSTLYGEKGNPNLLGLEIFNENMEKVSSGIIDTLDLEEVIMIRESQEHDRFVVCRYNQYSKLTEQELILSEVSNTGIVKWRKRVKSPMALQNLNVEDIQFSRSSSIFILCNYAFDLKNKNAISQQDMINNKYSLWAYDAKKDFLKEFELRLKGKWINGIKLGLNPQGKLIVSGYLNETRNHAISGVFSLLVDRNLNVLTSSFNKFDDTVREKFIELKDMKKTKELDDYTLNEIMVQPNGSYYLVGERFYKYIERNYDPRTNITTTTEHFNYNSIIVSYFDSLGGHLWTERVPKFQNSTNDFGYFASFSALNTPKGVYLFFNDTDKNNEVLLSDYFNYKGLFNNRRSQISYVQVDRSGITKRAPLPTGGNDFMLRAKQCRQISRDVMYLMGESGRQSRVYAIGIKK